jgi:toxin FitB
VLVVGEIRQGVERLRLRDPGRSQHHEDWLRALQESFGDRVLAITTPVAKAWGRLRAPGPLPVVDSLLAATALVHGLVVVTRDTAPFERVGVPWLDPWAP